MILRHDASPRRQTWSEDYVTKLAGVNHLKAVAALEHTGFKIVRQGAHIVMTNGVRIITIPRHNPVNAFTMAGIVKDAGLTIEQFKELL